jgi:hypothetical protein
MRATPLFFLKKERKMNNRERMRASNKLAVKHLLKNGYDEIWLKPHTARNDLVYCQDRKYLATDLWNLFDGICFGEDLIEVDETNRNKAYYIQVKTNAWATEEPILKFLKTHSVNVIVINVTNKLKSCKGKYKVFTREYQ